MRLIRFVAQGAQAVGVVDTERRVRSLSQHIDDLTGASLSPSFLSSLAQIDLSSLPVVEPDEILPPVSGTANFVGVGLNYRAHATETALDAPTKPLLFQKAVTSISGPFDDVVMPTGANKIDHEVELAVVIGAPAWQVARDDVCSVIAGYTICNDVSDRGWQFDGPGQWTIGKSAPTFGPLGPWLVTPDEVDLSAGLTVELDVNGETFQSASTSDMIFDIPTIVEFVSHRMRLEPGDVIATGTPEGVGFATGRYLKRGDTMTLRIEGLGHQQQTLV